MAQIHDENSENTGICIPGDRGLLGITPTRDFWKQTLFVVPIPNNQQQPKYELHIWGWETAPAIPGPRQLVLEVASSGSQGARFLKKRPITPRPPSWSAGLTIRESELRNACRCGHFARDAEVADRDANRRRLQDDEAN